MDLTVHRIRIFEKAKLGRVANDEEKTVIIMHVQNLAAFRRTYMNIRRLFQLTTALVVLGGIGLAVYAQKTTVCSSDDEKVYDGRIQYLKGKVIYLNHPDIGQMPATGQYLVFQRQDCKDCLVATNTDAEGNYKILVGVGRYKLIVQERACDYGGNCPPCHNLLPPDQPQYVDVEKAPVTEDFNIKLVLRKQ